MPKVLGDLSELPLGSHALGLYSGREEAAVQAMEFIAGAPTGQAPSFWVPDPETAEEYNRRLREAVPQHAGCVVPLDHPQVEPHGGKLRPATEILQFLSRHPDGVTAGADTLSRSWRPGNISERLEYEAWFEDQPRANSRFLCPYDLRTVPIEEAPAILSDLGRHHSHVVLSSSPEPAVRLLQLFVFGRLGEIPTEGRNDLEWAQSEGLVGRSAPDEPLRLSEAGRSVVREWAERTTVTG
jgi:hypothetical protein